jgi:hypothetical protein
VCVPSCIANCHARRHDAERLFLIESVFAVLALRMLMSKSTQSTVAASLASSRYPLDVTSTSNCLILLVRAQCAATTSRRSPTGTNVIARRSTAKTCFSSGWTRATNWRWRTQARIDQSRVVRRHRRDRLFAVWFDEACMRCVVNYSGGGGGWGFSLMRCWFA